MRVVALALCLGAAVAAPAAKPHVLFSLVDDYGHFDAGFSGNPDAPTPSIDALAAEGVILSRHYVYQFCSPTRSSLMSGRLPIHVNVDNNPTSKLGGVDLRMATLPEKLRSAGYRSTTVGKWHAGGHLYGQVPEMRGFDSSRVFLNGNEDHYTQYFGIKGCQGVDAWLNGSNAYGRNGSYGTYEYVNHVLRAIEFHDPATPMFIYAAWQNTHTPLEAPAKYVNASWAAQGCKTKGTYLGMVASLDHAVYNVTQAMKAKGMWENTLMIFSADNGGETGGGGNNHPYHGGKYTDFEGGTRAVAFLSGGFLPQAIRGTMNNHTLIHVCDWFATLSVLAGVDPTDTPADKSVPASDGVNVWPSVIGGTSVPSQRADVAVSSTALKTMRWSLVTSCPANAKNIWMTADYSGNCGNKTLAPGCDPEAPCLYDLDADPYEHTNLAADPAHAQVLAKLTAQLAAHAKTSWQTGADGFLGAYQNCSSEGEYTASHRGFVGPLCSKGSPRPGPPPGPPAPPPGPEPKGVTLRQGADCLAPAANAKRSAVTLGSCNDPERMNSGWSVPKTGGAVDYGGMCLRPADPPTEPADCKAGTKVFIGQCPSSSAGIALVGGKLVATACKAADLCVGTSAKLVPCAGASAAGWTVGK